MRVKLVPKTAKGKQRVKAHGDIGNVLRTEDAIQCRPGKVGPWLLVEAGDPFSRWVHKTHDDDFKVEIIEERE